MEATSDNILRFGDGINSSNITLRLGSLMLDLGNGDEVHIGGFDQTDVFNNSSISSFEFADGKMRWRSCAANDYAWRAAA